jgi:protein-S-isoprenylcysteine O-methyltransferase Ste14
MRFIPLAGVLLVAAIACCWRPWLQYRRHGTWGVFLFRSRSLRQLFRDAMLVLLYVLLLAQAVLAAGRPESGSVRLQTIGAVCMFAGIGLMVLSQLHLGASWRIGIDERAAPGLVTAGLYRYSRNPIYVALVVFVAGYTLLLPTPLSLALLAGALIGVWQQVRAEEAYLLGTYGECYREYARRVGRFLPGIGKLRK